MKTIIQNTDLYKNNYDIQTLIDNISALSLITILRTQHLTYEFCINYILNEKYQIIEEEKYIDIFDVCIHQKHLKAVMFINKYTELANNKDNKDYKEK
jgi:hypothetical protein